MAGHISEPGTRENMNRYRTGMLLAWLLLAALVLGGCVAPTPSPTLVSRMAHYTVQVIVTCPSGESHGGSGVLISPDGYIATAYHVVRAVEMDSACTINVGLGARVNAPTSMDYQAQLITRDPAMDVALLYITRDRNGQPVDLNLPYAEFATEGPRVGETIHILGFPSLTDGLLAYDSDTIISEGSCSAPETCWLLTEAFASWGSSGGPAFNDQGQLLGITLGQRRLVLKGNDHRLTTVRPVNVIRELAQSLARPATALETNPNTQPRNIRVDAWQAEVIGPRGVNWRSEPSTERGQETVLEVLPPGTVLHIIPPGEWRGWWATVDNRGRMGWIKEKTERVNLLRPYMTTITPRMAVGTQAVITCLTQAPCAHLTYSPGYAGREDASRVGSLPGGTRVTITEGPAWVNRLVWWRIQAGEMEGWLPEVTEEGYRMLAPAPVVSP